MEYIIWCDESIENGKYFSNFYGGALAKSIDLEFINNKISDTKLNLNLKDEVKWIKVTENYLDKYITLINVFFDLVESGKIKIRIMFTQNSKVNFKPTEYQHNNKFFLLYYQFIKHAFGFIYSNPVNEKINLRFYFDKLPRKKVTNEKFIEYIYNLQNLNGFKSLNFTINKENITEVDSKRHNIMQCLDIILGSIAFKLNRHNREKLSGKWKMGKRTIAKEKLYKEILQHIRKIYPRFNIGISTGISSNKYNYWKHPYRHWLFISNKDDAFDK